VIYLIKLFLKPCIIRVIKNINLILLIDDTQHLLKFLINYIVVIDIILSYVLFIELWDNKFLLWRERKVYSMSPVLIYLKIKCFEDCRHVLSKRDDFESLIMLLDICFVNDFIVFSPDFSFLEMMIQIFIRNNEVLYNEILLVKRHRRFSFVIVRNKDEVRDFSLFKLRESLWNIVHVLLLHSGEDYFWCGKFKLRFLLEKLVSHKIFDHFLEVFAIFSL